MRYLGRWTSSKICFLVISTANLMFPRVFKPPNRSPLWHLPPPPPIDPAKGYLPPSTIRVALPITVAGQKCPFERGDKVSWTEGQRLVAGKTVKVTSVEELIAKVSENKHIQTFSNIKHAVDNHGASKEP
jgi:hypothetical protein